MTNCKICDAESLKIFSKKILKKYDADYFKCSQCGFIQTSKEEWLKEAYDSAITKLDIGLLSRNIRLRTEISSIIDACFPDAQEMLDYAGGYGVLVRLMRDAGFNFYRQDIYCENLFAQKFDITDINKKQFGVVTAFEVFEHFVNPIDEIKKLFTYSDNIIFSTELYDHADTDIENWWYIAPETGQHVAFYSEKTLKTIAEKMGKKYYCKNKNVHVFTPLDLTQKQIDFAFNNVYYYKSLFGLKTEYFDFTKKRGSLLQQDFDYLKTKL